MLVLDIIFQFLGQRDSSRVENDSMSCSLIKGIGGSALSTGSQMKMQGQRWSCWWSNRTI